MPEVETLVLVKAMEVQNREGWEPVFPLEVISHSQRAHFTVPQPHSRHAILEERDMELV